MLLGFNNTSYYEFIRNPIVLQKHSMLLIYKYMWTIKYVICRSCKFTKCRELNKQIQTTCQQYNGTREHIGTFSIGVIVVIV